MSSDERAPFDELLARGARGARPGGPVAPAPVLVATAEAGAFRVALGGALWHAFGRPSSPGAGWWLMNAVPVVLAGETVVVDLLGFRRRRGDERPSGRPLRARPDWICEVIAFGGDADTARPEVFGGAPPVDPLAGAKVPWRWIAIPEKRSLTAYRWQDGRYVVEGSLGPGDVTRLAPFEEIELDVDEIFSPR